MKISATVQFHSEIEFLPGWFEDAKRYADEVVCAAHSPKDGSLEFVQKLKETYPIPIKILEFPEDIVFKNGFSYMKNQLIENSSGDWIVSLDADEEMEINKDQIIAYTGRTNCISTVTMHVKDKQDHWSLSNRKQIRDEAAWIRQRHYRIFRNIPEIRWYGLIHEELKYKGQAISSNSISTIFKMWHYGCMGDKSKRWFKDGLYAELLLRIVENPDLRFGTNHWWYDKYYIDNKDLLLKQREEYRKHIDWTHEK